MIERETIIAHILAMKELDPVYARHAMRWYADRLPWMDLVAGVKQTLQPTQPQTEAPAHHDQA